MRPLAEFCQIDLQVGRVTFRPRYVLLTSVTTEVVCPSYSTTNPEGARFCLNRGHAVNRELHYAL